MKKRRQRHKEQKKSQFDLIVKKFPERKVVQFPQLAGRIIDRVRLFTALDNHCISINFQDKTLLSLNFEPGFILKASLADVKTGNVRTIRRWPPIESEPR